MHNKLSFSKKTNNQMKTTKYNKLKLFFSNLFIRRSITHVIHEKQNKKINILDECDLRKLKKLFTLKNFYEHAQWFI